MSILQLMINFLTDSSHWTGPAGIPARLGEHLVYTVISLAIALAIALPIGFYIGHTGRFAFLAINIGNAARALPTIGLLILVVLLTSTGVLPVIVVLVVLAIPPLLTSTYAGIRAVDPAVVDAARGIGMTERQMLFQVEVPNALPVMYGGFRSAVLQVISTATVAAYVGLGGLGRYLIDGLARQDFGQMAGGAIIVAALAIIIDVGLGLIRPLFMSPGVTGKAAKRGRVDSQAEDEDETPPASSDSSPTEGTLTTGDPDRSEAAVR